MNVTPPGQLLILPALLPSSCRDPLCPADPPVLPQQGAASLVRATLFPLKERRGALGSEEVLPWPGVGLGVPWYIGSDDVMRRGGVGGGGLTRANKCCQQGTCMAHFQGTRLELWNLHIIWENPFLYPIYFHLYVFYLSASVKD